MGNSPLITLCPTDFLYGDEDFDAQYEVDESFYLGTGKFSYVHLCWRRNHPEKRYALKVITTKADDHVSLTRIYEEINIMKALGNHPAIIQLIDMDESMPATIRLVLELCEGGQLFDRIRARGFYEEPQAALVVRQVLEAVAFLHSKGVMHRDMKPENVLLVSRDSDTDVKVCDFGLAKLAPVSLQNPRGPRSMSFRGSDHYLAPEIIRQEEYGCEVDIWAVGVMSYAVLSGSLPFCAGDDLRATYHRIVDRQLAFDDEAWERASGLAVTFVSCLLTTNVAQRPKAATVVQHQWIINACASSDMELEEQDDEDEEEEAVSQQSEDDTDSTKSVVEVVRRSTARGSCRCMNC